MAGRIITARHGRPSLSRDVKITAREYGDWWARYDESGLHPGEIPPEGLVKLAAGARAVLCSTRPRAIETAREIAGESAPAPPDPLFVEAPLPPPPVPYLKLSPSTWGVISRTFWFLGYAPEGVESHIAAWERVRRVAALLTEHARDGDVILCAHGYLNWMIDRRLIKEGWTRAECDGGNRYWSWRIYEPAGQRDGVEAPAAAE
ncbi:MAG: histidine phosphatase family protein [Parvularculaceae bacterium]